MIYFPMAMRVILDILTLKYHQAMLEFNLTLQYILKLFRNPENIRLDYNYKSAEEGDISSWYIIPSIRDLTFLFRFMFMRICMHYFLIIRHAKVYI